MGLRKKGLGNTNGLVAKVAARVASIGLNGLGDELVHLRLGKTDKSREAAETPVVAHNEVLNAHRQVLVGLH